MKYGREIAVGASAAAIFALGGCANAEHTPDPYQSETAAQLSSNFTDLKVQLCDGVQQDKARKDAAIFGGAYRQLAAATNSFPDGKRQRIIKPWLHFPDNTAPTDATQAFGDMCSHQSSEDPMDWTDDSALLEGEVTADTICNKPDAKSVEAWGKEIHWRLLAKHINLIESLGATKLSSYVPANVLGTQGVGRSILVYQAELVCDKSQ